MSCGRDFLPFITINTGGIEVPDLVSFDRPPLQGAQKVNRGPR